jgi:putative transposase
MSSGMCYETASPRQAFPHAYPPWPTVSVSFLAWERDGTWERLNDELRELVRQRTGRNPQPSAAILDSQSAKTTEKGGLAATTEPRS